jgi:hypothetical protein
MTAISSSSPARLGSKISFSPEVNNQKVSELAAEQGLKVGQNVAAGVAGFVVRPLLFAMDFQDSASKEVVALQSRQQYLATLGGAEMCSRRPPNQHRFASAEPSSERRIGSDRLGAHG